MHNLLQHVSWSRGAGDIARSQTLAVPSMRAATAGGGHAPWRPVGFGGRVSANLQTNVQMSEAQAFYTMHEAGLRHV
jgi:hypothetical protein